MHFYNFNKIKLLIVKDVSVFNNIHIGILIFILLMMYSIEDARHVYTSIHEFAYILSQRLLIILTPVIIFYCFITLVKNSANGFKPLEELTEVRISERYIGRILSTFLVIFSAVLLFLTIDFIIIKNYSSNITYRDFLIIVEIALITIIFCSLVFGLIELWFNKLIGNIGLFLLLVLVAFSVFIANPYTMTANQDFTFAIREDFKIMNSILVKNLSISYILILVIIPTILNLNQKKLVNNYLTLIVSLSLVFAGLTFFSINKTYKFNLRLSEAIETAIYSPEELHNSHIIENVKVYSSNTSLSSYLDLARFINIPNLIIVETPYISHSIWRSDGKSPILLVPEIESVNPSMSILRRAFINFIPRKALDIPGEIIYGRDIATEWACLEEYSNYPVNEERKELEDYLNKKSISLVQLADKGIVEDEIVAEDIKRALSRRENARISCPTILEKWK